MRVRTRHISGLAVLLLTTAAIAQTPVAVSDSAYPVSAVRGAEIETIGNDDPPPLPARDLETLVGPVALYPDSLLAIILPASAYPLQIVQAARFLDEIEQDSTLEPSPDWDESVIALLNYPEVLRQLSDDIDWTLQLGEAVVYQQADVMAAVQRFRDRAVMAGNLKTDSHQRIVNDDSVIEIQPVDDDVIYVPVYEPAAVVQYSARPVYAYRPNPYPVYYYPYPDRHAFHSSYFWGLTTAYSLGWQSSRVHVVHHSYAGHPYYGHNYSPRWWYRRPTVAHHNRVYQRPDRYPTHERTRSGDYWVPRQSRYSILRVDRDPRSGASDYRVRRHENTMVRRTAESTRTANYQRQTTVNGATTLRRDPERRTGGTAMPQSVYTAPRSERQAPSPGSSIRRANADVLRPATTSQRRVGQSGAIRQPERPRHTRATSVSRPAPTRPATRAPSVSRPAREATPRQVNRRDSPGRRDTSRRRDH